MILQAAEILERVARFRPHIDLIFIGEFNKAGKADEEASARLHFVALKSLYECAFASSLFTLIALHLCTPSHAFCSAPRGPRTDTTPITMRKRRLPARCGSAWRLYCTEQHAGARALRCGNAASPTGQHRVCLDEAAYLCRRRSSVATGLPSEQATAEP